MKQMDRIFMFEIDERDEKFQNGMRKEYILNSVTIDAIVMAYREDVRMIRRMAFRNSFN